MHPYRGMKSTESRQAEHEERTVPLADKILLLQDMAAIHAVLQMLDANQGEYHGAAAQDAARLAALGLEDSLGDLRGAMERLDEDPDDLPPILGRSVLGAR